MGFFSATLTKEQPELVSKTVTSQSDQEFLENYEALVRTLQNVQNLGQLQSKADKKRALQVVLDTVRATFGWAYGSFWELNNKGNALVFSVQSGHVNSEFEQVTQTASFEKGVGFSGKTWQKGRLFYVKDLGEMTDCCRRESAQRAGVKSGVCFPIFVQGQIIGTVDFFALDVFEISPERQKALESLGVVLSLVFERISSAESQNHIADCLNGVQNMVGLLNSARSEQEVYTLALRGIKDTFGFDYASFWRYDTNKNVLVFQEENGSVSPAFSQVTRNSSFARGVGVNGKAWSTNEIVFVPDLADVHDCVRAPSARDAGVKSGSVIPIVVQGNIVGTLDFFSNHYLKDSMYRQDAMKNIRFLIENTLEKFAKVGLQQEAALASREISENMNRTAQMSENTQAQGFDTQQVMEALTHSAVEINSIVSLIQSIASQTNLLALNATIEAARAGEAGKGFAVVADEVKALAGKSAEATQNIHKQVRTIQEQTQRASASIDEIISMVREISAANSSIAAAVEEQNVIINNLAN